MKIVCDSCGAKYSIADEKVQGKVFKIRCKKCSNVIVVKGTASGESAAVSDSLGGSSAAEWYVVIDGEQVGPVTVADVEAYYASGRIAADTYGWRDGMGDWQHVADIPEFAHLAQEVAGPNEATQIAGAGGFASGEPDYHDEVDATNVMQSPLGNAASDPTMGDSPSALGYGGDPYPSDPDYGDEDSDAGYGGGFASFGDSGGYGGGGDLAVAGADEDDGAGMFAAFDSGDDSDFMNFDAAPAPSNGANGHASNGSNGAVGENLIGQRNENSVLFSLSSLDNVSKDAPSAQKEDVPLTEGSGLIDIQALASAHKNLSTGGEMGGDSGIDPFAQGTMAMPALMPMGSHKSNKGLIAAAVGGGVLLLGLAGAVAYMAFSKDEEKPPQEKVIIREVVKEAAPAVAVADQQKQAAEAAAAAEQALAAAPEKVEEEEGKEEGDSKAAATSRTSKKSTSKKTQQKKSDPDPEPDPEPAPKKTSSKKGIDGILAGLDEKGDSSKSSSSQKKSTAKSSLSRSDVKNTIARYQSRVSNCAKEGKSGSVKVKFYIQPNGRTRSASVLSSGFKGTPTGSCIEKVVGSMKFPETTASKDVPVTYPFILK